MTPKQTALGCAVLIVACVMCSCIGAALGRGNTSGTNTSAKGSNNGGIVNISGQATSAPTITPVPSGPRLANGLELGGTEQQYTTACGDPTSTVGTLARYTCGIAGGQQVAVCFCDATTGTDGQQRAEIIKIGPTMGGASWDQATALLTAQIFSPADATFLRTIQDPDVGELRVYHSDDLARTFPTSAFTASGPNSGVVHPGDFTVACAIPNVPSGCTIATGV